MIPDIDVSVTLTSRLRLAQALKKAGINDPATVARLTVAGTLTEEDFEYIYDNMRETLHELDMGSVWVKKNEIPYDAFCYCTGLTSITLPNSVTEIGAYAFEDCTGLAFITFPPSMKKIGEGAFRACTDLTSITLPDSVTEIGECAFSLCTGLASITLPDSV